LVVNPTSGTAGGEDLGAVATRELGDVRSVTLEPDLDLGSVIDRAVGEDRVVVACGGDGTVSAVAQHLAGTDGVMGVLPGGTLNHFARDLGVLDPKVALEVLATGAVSAVDVGRAGDRVFVNNLGLGLYPELVRERESREGVVGKVPAMAMAAVHVLRDFDPLGVRMTVDGDAREFEAAAIFVGNNRISQEPTSFGQRARLDEGVLDIRVLRGRRGWRSGLAAGRRALTRSAGPVVGVRGMRVEIELLGNPRPMAVDGEQGWERDRFEIQVEAGALRVLRPS
jgi:undecaprenyl-diphosphatase